MPHYPIAFALLIHVIYKLILSAFHYKTIDKLKLGDLEELGIANKDSQ